MNWLEEFWGDMLSEEPLRIMAAWLTLDPESQATVRGHLLRMITEEGYAESQRDSANAALAVIEDEANA